MLPLLSMDKSFPRSKKRFLTLLGIAKGDTEEQLQKLIAKIIALRIFPDENGKMNLSLKDIGGSHLIVSQFTLLGDASKGNRPSFIGAESPDLAKKLYEKALELSKAQYFYLRWRLRC